jgi:bile acid:Na+ symporter, BASS family
MIAKLVLGALQLSLMLIVFSTGLSARVGDARHLLNRPKHLAKTLLSMNVLMPLLVLVAIRSFALHPAVKIALFTLAISPVPPMLPRKAASADSRHYMLSLLLTTSVFAVATVPLSFAAGMAIIGRSDTVPVAKILVPVFVTLVAPFAMGMLVRGLAPTFADRALKPIVLVANVLLLASVVPVLITASGPIWNLMGNGTLLAFAAFAGTGLLIGHLLGGPEPGERVVLAIATASRHPGIALVVAQSAFPTQTEVLPALLSYLLVESLVSVAYVRWVKRRRTAHVPALVAPGREAPPQQH